MSNVRLSLPLRWSALPAEPLRPSAWNNEEPAFGRRGLVGVKTVRSPYCYYSYFLPHAEKTERSYKAAKGKNPLLLV